LSPPRGGGGSDVKPAQRHKTFNRIGDAYVNGLAPWLYDERGCVAVRTWCEAGSEEAGDAALLGLLKRVEPLFTGRERGALSGRRG